MLSKVNRKVAIYIGVTILLIFFFLVYLIHAVSSLGETATIQQEAFNKKKWHAGRMTKEDGYGGSRDMMIEDLNKNYLKIGMTKNEIIKLLGIPDDKKCGGIGVEDNRILSYRIGYEFLDPCSLDIELDNEGKVKSFEKCCN